MVITISFSSQTFSVHYEVFTKTIFLAVAELIAKLFSVVDPTSPPTKADMVALGETAALEHSPCKGTVWPKQSHWTGSRRVTWPELQAKSILSHLCLEIGRKQKHSQFPESSWPLWSRFSPSQNIAVEPDIKTTGLYYCLLAHPDTACWKGRREIISKLGSALRRSLWFHESENRVAFSNTTLSSRVHRIPCSQSSV